MLPSRLDNWSNRFKIASEEFSIPYRILHLDQLHTSQGNEIAIMNAMVDIMSNSVVVVGGDRLGDALARQKLKEYNEYLEKRSQNLIRIPKSQDGKLKKGRWKK